MRGADIHQDSLFSTVIPEERVPKDHPLRPIHEMVNAALIELDAGFNALYPAMGRDSIPPEKLPRTQLLMAFYTIRSELPADGAARLQSAVSVVRVFFDGRQGLEPLGIPQEPGSSAGR